MDCSGRDSVAHLSNGSRRRILICGYYGEHNLGDDALLAVLLSQIQGQWIPVITANDQKAVEALAPGSETVNRRSLKSVLTALRNVDALVLGGGSLLQDATSTRSLMYYIILIWCAKSLQKPVFLWGQGLGPLKRRISRLLVRTTLKTLSSVTWRDPGAMKQAIEWKLNVPMKMGPDPVWTHPAPTWRSGRSLVICWRPTPLLNHKGWLKLVSALARLAEMHDCHVTWLAFHEHQDSGLLHYLSQEKIVASNLEKRSSTVTAQSIKQVQQLFSQSKMVIAMRLHALILAALGGVPTSALSYDPKVKAAADLSGIACTELSNALSEEELMHQWTLAMQKPLNGSILEKLKDEAKVHSETLNVKLQELIN